MTAPKFTELLGWEWRRTGRSPLLWTVIAILAAALGWGAVNTAALHRAQQTAQHASLAADRAWQARTVELAEAFHAPATQEAGQVAYWQDPTNIAGYSEYFVRRPALKPHLVLSPLAAGVSDLAPSRLEIKLNTPFGFLDTYDFENPRGLALGRFDLAFVIVFLLPIGLLLLFALLVTFERDRGMLPLVAAQATGPRSWVAARVAAILLWMVPAIVLAIVAALAIAGVPLGAVAAPLAIALLVTIAYMLFWSGIALILLRRQPGAGSALGSFAAVWAVLTIGLPMAASALVGAVDPAPSSVGYVDAQRRIGDEIQAQRDTIVAQAIAARADLRPFAHRIAGLDHATRLSFLVPATERRLAPRWSERHAHRARQDAIAHVAGHLIPPLGVESVFATLAGTDAGRQRMFEAQAQHYQQRLRTMVHPLVQREIARAPVSAERTTRGRLNLPEPLDLPAFALVDHAPAERVAAVLPFAAWLTLLAGLTILIGLRMTHRWNMAR